MSPTSMPLTPAVAFVPSTVNPPDRSDRLEVANGLPPVGNEALRNVSPACPAVPPTMKIVADPAPGALRPRPGPNVTCPGLM